MSKQSSETLAPRGATDLAACRAILSNGSRSFGLAAALLPVRVAKPAAALYAFCRQADDAVDHGPCTSTTLTGLRQQLDRLFGNSFPETPVERLFSRVIEEHRLPRPILDALLEGFAWDAEGRRYETLSDLYGYGARVAGTVGILMTLLMGVRSAEALARACELGIAMQLTNIARDVGEDAQRKRLYLPLTWMRSEGIEPDRWLESPRHSPALKVVVERLLCAADALYERARGGIPYLPTDCRFGIHAASLFYAEIGQELRRCGHNCVAQRVHVRAARKAWLLLTSAGAAATSVRRREQGSGLEEARFLLDAIHRDLVQDRCPPARASDSEWLMGLFESLYLRDQESVSK